MISTAKNNMVESAYNLVSSIDWENLLDADGYFSVSSVVHNDTVRDTRLPSLVTKDAIADRMRAKCNRRPDSGPDYDLGAAVFLHWEKQRMVMYLDTSGAPLSKRGYRKIPGADSEQLPTPAFSLQESIPFSPDKGHWQSYW